MTFDKPVMLVDGLSLFIRNFIANPTTIEGNHLGGTLGFLKMLEGLIERHSPKECVVVWEGGGSRRRRDIWPEYKNYRRPMKLNRFYEGEIPDTLENRNWQIQLLVSLLRNAPVRQVYVSDCEADDVIAYLARYSYDNSNVLIVSSDHDYLQLITDRIKVWSPTLKDLVDSDWVRERYGVLPHNLCVARCFAGDGSDGLPGVEHVGVKTLINRFPFVAGEEKVSVEDVISAALADPKRERVKAIASIIQNAEIPRRNWRLMHLDTANLSGSQVSFIQGALELPRGKSNKLAFIRTLLKYKIQSFNVDKFIMILTSNLGN